MKAVFRVLACICALAVVVIGGAALQRSGDERDAKQQDTLASEPPAPGSAAVERSALGPDTGEACDTTGRLCVKGVGPVSRFETTILWQGESVFKATYDECDVANARYSFNYAMPFGSSEVGAGFIPRDADVIAVSGVDSHQMLVDLPSGQVLHALVVTNGLDRAANPEQINREFMSLQDEGLNVPIPECARSEEAHK